MADDRYAPPQAKLENDGLVPGTGAFDVGIAVREGWERTWANFGVLLGAGFVCALLMALSALTIIGAFLIVPVLAWGAIRVALNAYDGEARFGDLWTGFSEYGQALVTMLVLYLLQTLLSVLGQSVSTIGGLTNSPSLSFLGILIAIAWTFLVTSRLNFAWLFAVDQGMGPVEALQAAWDATAQQKLNCVVLFILSIVIPMIGVLGLIVLVIPATMISFLMQVSAYRQMVGRRSAAS